METISPGYWSLQFVSAADALMLGINKIVLLNKRVELNDEQTKVVMGARTLGKRGRPTCPPGKCTKNRGGVEYLQDYINRDHCVQGKNFCGCH